MVDETSFIAPVTLAMEPHRNLGVRRLDEAEDPAGPLIDPELEVLHTILTMGPDVLGMVVSNVFGRRSLEGSRANP
jgi:hypothetical protein